MSDLILGAFMARRAILIDLGTGIKLIGSRFSSDSRRLREFLARNRMPYKWIDLETTTQAEGLLARLGVAAAETPVVIASDGEILRNPSSAELGEALGLGSPAAPPELCDVVVVGAGPAGLSAALYAASEGLAIQGVEAVATGGQAGTSSRIENYLGFPAGISGNELTQRAFIQAGKFGARLTTPAERSRCIASRGDTRSSCPTGSRSRVGRWSSPREPSIAARGRTAGRVRGRRRLLRRNPGRGSAVQRRPGRDRRRGKLRRAGGNVPFRNLALPAADSRR